MGLYSRGLALGVAIGFEDVLKDMGVNFSWVTSVVLRNLCSD